MNQLNEDYSILIVEDARTINNVLHSKLQNEGYTSYQSFDLATAQDILQRQSISLVILDLHLPDGEGEELIFAVQELSKDSKIIIFTSDNDTTRRDELFRLGILDYIIKGKHVNIIFKEILNIIQNLQVNPNYNILIVDDSTVVRMMMKKTLLPAGYNILEAKNGKEAIDIVKTKKVDLILLDNEMSDIQGLEVLKIIKKDENFFSLPVFMVSSNSNVESIRSTYKEGASEYITKPFSPEELKLKIEFWIKRYQNENELNEIKETVSHYQSFIDNFFAAAIFSQSGKLKWSNEKFNNFIASEDKTIMQIFDRFDKSVISIITTSMRKKESFQSNIVDKDDYNYNLKLFPMKLTDNKSDFLVIVEFLH